jgi:hypothetical protein
MRVYGFKCFSYLNQNPEEKRKVDESRLDSSLYRMRVKLRQAVPYIRTRPRIYVLGLGDDYDRQNKGSQTSYDTSQEASRTPKKRDKRWKMPKSLIQIDRPVKRARLLEKEDLSDKKARAQNLQGEQKPSGPCQGRRQC